MIVRQLVSVLETNKPFFIYIDGQSAEHHHCKHIPQPYFKNYITCIKIHSKFIKLDLSSKLFELYINKERQPIPRLSLSDFANTLNPPIILQVSSELLCNSNQYIKKIYISDKSIIEII